MCIENCDSRVAEPRAAPLHSQWLHSGFTAGFKLTANARKAFGWPKRCKLACAFTWDYIYKGLKLAQLLGQLGVFLTRKFARLDNHALFYLEEEHAIFSGGHSPLGVNVIQTPLPIFP